jgi:XTP/dITP diphosphohydrolase
MLPIILATRNPGKVAEIRSILSVVPLEIRSLMDLPEVPEVIEDGSTLTENALKKAEEVYRRLRVPTVSDDSGLEVYALGMKPGVLSARYAGEGVTYAENNRKLLRELSGHPPKARRARFRCIAAFVAGETVRTFEGVCPGTITEEARGEGGFGYDPLFVPDGYEQTFAELSAETKNRISHRAQAFILLGEFLRKYVDNFS